MSATAVDSAPAPAAAPPSRFDGRGRDLASDVAPQGPGDFASLVTDASTETATGDVKAAAKPPAPPVAPTVTPKPPVVTKAPPAPPQTAPTATDAVVAQAAPPVVVDPTKPAADALSAREPTLDPDGRDASAPPVIATQPLASPTALVPPPAAPPLSQAAAPSVGSPDLKVAAATDQKPDARAAVAPQPANDPAAPAPPTTAAASPAIAAEVAAAPQAVAAQAFAQRLDSADARPRSTARSGGSSRTAPAASASAAPFTTASAPAAVNPGAAVFALVEPPPPPPADPAAAQSDEAAPSPETPAVVGQAQGQAADQALASASTPAAQAVRGAPDTVASFAAELVRRLDQRTSKFEVALNPHGLGRVDVSLKIAADGALSAAFRCDQAGGAQALKDRIGELTATLATAGFTLAPDAVRIDTTTQGFAASTGFSDTSDGRNAPGDGRTQTPASAWRAANDTDDALLSAASSPYASGRASRGLDIRI